MCRPPLSNCQGRGSGQSGLSESDKVSSVQKRRHAGACAAAKRGFKSKMLCFPQHWETYIVYNGVFISKDRTSTVSKLISNTPAPGLAYDN